MTHSTVLRLLSSTPQKQFSVIFDEKIMSKIAEA